MTDAERALWSVLRTYRPRFNHQLAVAGRVLDFACRKARVAIELDGGQHDGSERDMRRTETLEDAGWKVLRFWNHDVLRNRDGVLEVILAAVAERVPTEEAHPGPSRKSGRGGSGDRGGANPKKAHPQPLPEIREGRNRNPHRRPASSPGFPGGDRGVGP
jgi:very-short-patch-repair endonuclease